MCEKCRQHEMETGLLPEFEMLLQNEYEASSGSMSRDDLKNLQRLLNKFTGITIREDGLWGDKTRNSLNIFQKKYGIAVTSEPDSKTLNTLIKIEMNKDSNTKPLFEIGYFDYNSSKPGNTIIHHCFLIADMLLRMGKDPGIKGLSIFGFTDSTGSEKNNLHLGFLRALEVEKILRCAFNHFKTDSGKPFNLPIEIYSGGETFAIKDRPGFSRQVKVKAEYKNPVYYDPQKFGFWPNYYSRCNSSI